MNTEQHIIKDNPRLAFVVRKFERIGGAVYILTDSFDSHEPLKLSLREIVLQIIKLLLDVNADQKVASVRSLSTYFVLLVSLAKDARLLSQMNCEILKEEVSKMLIEIEEVFRVGVGGSKLPPDFFIVDKNDERTFPKQSGRKLGVLGAAKRTIKDNAIAQSDIVVSGVSNTRDTLILDVIKNRGEVSIKDIASIVKGVSSKTVQRSLITLVQKGIIKRTGERRWSKYSLA